MGWEITWRVLSGPGGAQERPEPFAIEGEVLEFRLGHSVALHERAGHRAGFWSREEPFSLWITGTRRVGPIRGTEERPHVLRYNFAYPGEKRLQFGGVPAPVGEFREPHPAGDVLVNLGWQVFPTNSPTAVEVRNRAARPGRGAAVATSTGSSSTHMISQ